MEAKDTWEDFCYAFIETGFVDYDRAKTLTAMRKLWERITQDDLNKLAGTLVFAPSTDIAGEVKRLSCEGTFPFLYLSQSLESKPQENVDAIVAHEFAHVVLGATRPGYDRNIVTPGELRHEDLPSEKDADELVAKWGFALP